LPDDYFRIVGQQLREVTLEDLRRAGEARIHPDRLKVLVVGDRQAVEPGLQELELPLVTLDSNGSEVAPD
jgi:zinc protease